MPGGPGKGPGPQGRRARADCIIEPEGGGPPIWFQVAAQRKTVKNRLHLDVRVSGGRAVPLATRGQRVDAEGSQPQGEATAGPRRASLAWRCR